MFFGPSKTEIHEAGHAVIAMHYGMKIKYIKIHGFSGQCYFNGDIDDIGYAIIAASGAMAVKEILGHDDGGDANDKKVVDHYAGADAARAYAISRELCRVNREKILQVANDIRKGKYEQNPFA